jgi:hypothetical protein
MRTGWNWLLAHAHGTRVVVFVVLITMGTVAGWYLWKNGGYTENAPPTPQFMEVYVDGSADSAAVSVTSVVVPVDAAGRECAVEEQGCDAAREYVTMRITPQHATPTRWMLVADTAPAWHAHQWAKARVMDLSKIKNQLAGFPGRGVWVHQGEIDNGIARTFSAQFIVHLVARPSDHLVVQMPALVNEVNPQSWCGHEVEYSVNPAQLYPTAESSACPIEPGQPGWTPTVGAPPPTLPFAGPAPYYAPGVVTSTEQLVDPTGMRGFTLDASDNATPVAPGFEWTGDYSLEPAIYATDISASGSVTRRQILLGVLIGVSLAALLGLIQEFYTEKRRTDRPMSESSE